MLALSLARVSMDSAVFVATLLDKDQTNKKNITETIFSVPLPCTHTSCPASTECKHRNDIFVVTMIKTSTQSMRILTAR